MLKSTTNWSSYLNCDKKRCFFSINYVWPTWSWKQIFIAGFPLKSPSKLIGFSKCVLFDPLFLHSMLSNVVSWSARRYTLIDMSSLFFIKPIWRYIWKIFRPSKVVEKFFAIRLLVLSSASLSETSWSKKKTTFLHLNSSTLSSPPDLVNLDSNKLSFFEKG